MKRTVGTVVLFVLLVLTAVALTQLDANNTTALKTTSVSNPAN